MANQIYLEVAQSTFYLEKLKVQRGRFYRIDTETPRAALLMDTDRPFEMLPSSSSEAPF